MPSGWDSWGKIRILRERFDADAVGKGWELDMDRMKARAQDDEERLDSEGRKVVSTIESYAQIVVDLDADDQASLILLCPYPFSGLILLRCDPAPGPRAFSPRSTRRAGILAGAL